MRYVIGCMHGHQADASDADEMMAFGADDSPPCGECGAPTFPVGVEDQSVEEYVASVPGTDAEDS